MILISLAELRGFPDGSGGKESVNLAGRHGFNPWAGRSLDKRKATNSKLFLPEKSHMNRGTWWANAKGQKESDMTQQLSTAAQGTKILTCRNGMSKTNSIYVYKVHTHRHTHNLVPNCGKSLENHHFGQYERNQTLITTY